MVYGGVLSVASCNMQLYVMAVIDDPDHPSADERTFSSAEVCLAVGLPRPTFDAWMLRGYMSLPPGPGTGRARRFSVTNAVRLAVTAELSRLGVSVSAAARAAQMIWEPFEADGRRVGLLLTKSPAPKGHEGLSGPAVMKLTFRTLDDVMFHVALRHGSTTPGFTVLDVTDIAERTVRALEGNTATLDTPAWLERYLHAPTPAATPAPGEAAPKPRVRSRKAAAPKE